MKVIKDFLVFWLQVYLILLAIPCLAGDGSDATRTIMEMPDEISAKIASYLNLPDANNMDHSCKDYDDRRLFRSEYFRALKKQLGWQGATVSLAEEYSPDHSGQALWPVKSVVPLPDGKLAVVASRPFFCKAWSEGAFNSCAQQRLLEQNIYFHPWFLTTKLRDVMRDRNLMPSDDERRLLQKYEQCWLDFAPELHVSGGMNITAGYCYLKALENASISSSALVTANVTNIHEGGKLDWSVLEGNEGVVAEAVDLFGGFLAVRYENGLPIKIWPFDSFGLKKTEAWLLPEEDVSAMAALPNGNLVMGNTNGEIVHWVYNEDEDSWSSLERLITDPDDYSHMLRDTEYLISGQIDFIASLPDGRLLFVNESIQTGIWTPRGGQWEFDGTHRHLFTHKPECLVNLSENQMAVINYRGKEKRMSAQEHSNYQASEKYDIDLFQIQTDGRIESVKKGIKTRIEQPTALSTTSDGDLLVGFSDGSIDVLHQTNGGWEIAKTLPGNEERKAITTIRFISGANLVLAGTLGGSIKMWNL